jgi:predicted acylesterase/phospholipase RssA
MPPALNPAWPAGQKKIALVMGGGGSLGAYEAGVLIELMYALDTLNAELPEQDRFVVDVITGASAGGMSAAVMARVMMYDYPGGRADLYKAWVRDIRIEDSPAGKGLLEDDSLQKNALLSKTIIRRIANDYLVEAVRKLDPQNLKPASFAPDELRLALTLTNMNGLDYSLPTTTVAERSALFLTTRFSDASSWVLTRQPHLSDWGADKLGIRDSAIACGNFPIAFQPQGLHRDASLYPQEPMQSTAQPQYFPSEMTFIDGGMFDNEPLGKAIGQAAHHDLGADGQPDPKRLFLVVHPNLTRSGHRNGVGDDSAEPTPFTSPEFGLLAQAGRLLDMLRTENAITDWVRASEVNALVQWRDAFIEILESVILETKVDAPDALIERLDGLVREIAETTKRPGLTAKEYLRRIRVTPDPTLGPRQTRIFETILFILDHVSELQEKRRLWLETIGHDPDLPLAGGQVMGFAGFFDEEWRIYDYRRGRVDAWRTLSGWSETDKRHDAARAVLGVYEGEAPDRQPTRGIEKPTPDGNSDYNVALPYWRARTRLPHFPRVSWPDVPEKMQKRLIERVLNRLLGEFHLNFVVETLVKSFGKSKIEGLLAGSPGEDGERLPADR